MVSHFKWQTDPQAAHVYSDSDWAGCVRTRRSTSGGILYYGNHVVKTWSVTQATIALSSGEAEYSADVKGASILLGFNSLLRDLGVQGVRNHLHTDSSAAMGVAQRTGIGKIRHLAVHLLWLQGKVRDKSIAIHKVAGTANPADVLTKHVGQDGLLKHFSHLCLEQRSGRAESAPKALI